MNKKDLQRVISSLNHVLNPQSVLKKRVKLKKDILFYKECPLFNISQKIFVVSIGKAAYSMGTFFKDLLNADTLIINTLIQNEDKNIFRGTHPEITERSFELYNTIKEFLSKTTEDDIVIFCISGGTSALIEKNSSLISKERLIELNQKLLKSSLGIIKTNLLRQCFSNVKGGGLLKLTKSQTFSFILSDIIGGKYELVGSGPTIPVKKDNDFYRKCMKILKTDKNHDFSTDYLINKINGLLNKPVISEKIPETHYIKLLKPSDSLKYSKEIFESFNFKVIDFIKDFNSDLDELINILNKKKEKLKNKEIILINGEVLYKVIGSGYGGRVQEFTLRAIKILEKDMFAGGIATDGIDGITPIGVSGVFFSEKDKYKINKENYLNTLKNNNSYQFFKDFKSLINTGVSGSNLADIYFLGKS